MNILLIDDEPLRMKDRLDNKHNIWVAHGSNQVDWYLSHSRLNFDLILLDHDMPMMDGHDIAHLYLCERSIPVVVHSMNEWGAMRICGILKDFAVPHTRIRLDDNDFQLNCELFFIKVKGEKFQEDAKWLASKIT